MKQVFSLCVTFYLLHLVFFNTFLFVVFQNNSSISWSNVTDSNEETQTNKNLTIANNFNPISVKIENKKIYPSKYNKHYNEILRHYMYQRTQLFSCTYFDNKKANSSKSIINNLKFVFFILFLKLSEF